MVCSLKNNRKVPSHINKLQCRSVTFLFYFGSRLTKRIYANQINAITKNLVLHGVTQEQRLQLIEAPVLLYNLYL